ncbi:Ferredoxin [hydrothermal vent metagenome]|uniref:Ferredoxin n=1 Tax=hydrothermal vent metagenome TaxID=652676 RepID=A0A3B1BFR0_9ZZZZ
MIAESTINTLRYDPDKCVNCLMCVYACPHAVFAPGERVVRIVHHDNCMECGACALNCAPEAIKVDSGVGCAYSMMRASLFGKKDAVCC